MKKLRTPYTKRLPPMRLYRDDIDQLAAILENNKEEITLTAGQYALNSVTQFDELKRMVASETVYSLELSTASHSCKHCANGHGLLTVTLARRSAGIYVSDEDDTTLMGMASQVERFLNTRRSLVSYAASWPVATSAVLALGILSIVSNIALLLGNINYLLQHGLPPMQSVHFVIGTVWANVLSMLTFMYFAWAMYINNFRYSVVYLDERIARPGFVRRNKDALIVAVISAILGAVLGAVVTAILTASH